MEKTLFYVRILTKNQGEKSERNVKILEPQMDTDTADNDLSRVAMTPFVRSSRPDKKSAIICVGLRLISWKDDYADNYDVNSAIRGFLFPPFSRIQVLYRFLFIRSPHQTALS